MEDQEKPSEILQQVNNLINAKNFTEDFIANGEIHSIQPITQAQAQQALVEIGEVCKKYKIYTLKFSLIKKF